MQTVELPTKLVQILVAIKHNWAIVVAAIITALLVAFVMEYIKHRFTLKQAQALATTGVKLAQSKLHVLLVLISTLFAGLEYYIPFLQQHLRTLETLPYLGAYVVSIYAAANFLYALKAKTWFQAVLKTATKLDAKVNAAQPSVQPSAPLNVQPQPQLPETESNFVS